jgi:Rho-binding antiterminator
MPSDYQPIPCADHERLEFAVLRRRPLNLVWQRESGDEPCAERVLPVDVETREGAEWLTLERKDGTRERVRLDCIRSVDEA